MREILHFIAGAAVPGCGERFAEVHDPLSGLPQARVPLGSRAELDQAVQAAAAAQSAWAAVNPQRRARVLFEFKRLVESRMQELAELLSSEHGKMLADSRGDIERGLDVIEFACGIPHLLKGEYTEGAGPGIDVYSLRQPLGVVAGITPFNFPAMIPMWMFGPAIACGNAFILKPSEKDPSVPVRLAELMMEAGAPAGILSVVHGDKEAVDAIVAHPLIQAVSFVGSSEVAQYVYAGATALGKRVQAMGGAKNHGIVLPDADLDQAVRDIAGAAFGSAGERCMALPVVVPVGERTAEALRARLVAAIGRLKVGAPADPEADYGPLVSSEHRERVLRYIRMGVDEGAELVVDGRGLERRGAAAGLLPRSDALRSRDPLDAQLPGGDLRSGPADRPRRELRGSPGAALRTPLRKRRGDLHAQRQRRARVRGARERRHGRHQRPDPRARRLSLLRRLEALRVRRREPARHGRRALLHPDQDGHRALARRRGRARAGGRSAQGLLATTSPIWMTGCPLVKFGTSLMSSCDRASPAW